MVIMSKLCLKDLKKIASSKTCELASIANEDKRLYAVQFHPEVRHTMYGNQILHNFVFKICKACANWQMENFVEEQVMKIKQEVKEKSIVCLIWWSRFSCCGNFNS